MSDADDNKELNELLAVTDAQPVMIKGLTENPIGNMMHVNMHQNLAGLVQWTTRDNKIFVPSGRTRSGLIPGVYEIHTSDSLGVYFEKINVRTEGLVKFSQTNIERVIKEIEKFWDREDLFKEYNILYRRGIILYGPPGGGKTCCVNLLMNDVINRGGIVIKFTSPSLFIEGLRMLREIEPNTPIIVLMEDIDAIIEHYNESSVLQILDGVEQISRIVYLATTNYPEKLGARIINRPSRFDRRFKIGYPNKDSREVFIKHLCKEKLPEDLGINIDQWVKDTKGFTISHLKELFIAVVIQGDSYEETVENLKAMKETYVSSEKDDEDKQMGFCIKN